MNIDEQILAELRKLSAWSDMQRKMTKWSLIFVAVFVPALIVFAVVMERREKTLLEGVASEKTLDWYDVDQSVRRGDFDKAIRLGEELAQKTPLYPEAHRRLAGAYLAAGNLEEAREHYAEAFRLFPSEEHEKLLLAIERRVQAAKSQPNGATTDSRSIRAETNRAPSATGVRR
jgi:tetratricopeptide (TPR) repeat protein